MAGGEPHPTAITPELLGQKLIWVLSTTNVSFPLATRPSSLWCIIYSCLFLSFLSSDAVSSISDGSQDLLAAINSPFSPYMKTFLSIELTTASLSGSFTLFLHFQVSHALILLASCHFLHDVWNCCNDFFFFSCASIGLEQLQKGASSKWGASALFDDSFPN